VAPDDPDLGLLIPGEGGPVEGEVPSRYDPHRGLRPGELHPRDGAGSEESGHGAPRVGGCHGGELVLPHVPHPAEEGEELGPGPCPPALAAPAELAVHAVHGARVHKPGEVAAEEGEEIA